MTPLMLADQFNLALKNYVLVRGSKGWTLD